MIVVRHGPWVKVETVGRGTFLSLSLPSYPAGIIDVRVAEESEGPVHEEGRE